MNGSLKIAYLLMLALAPCAGATAAGPGAPPPATGRAEVQINVCGDPKAAVRALALRADSEVREVWYFDTRGRALFSRGVVFRLRSDGAAFELTLKAARQDCTAMPASLLSPADGKCEYDWHGDDVRGAVSLSQRISATKGRALQEARTTLAAVLSPAQARFLREQLRIWPLPADVVPIGPATLRAYRPERGRYVLEVWELPATPPYIEISRKSSNRDAPRVREDLLALLERAGIAACTDQASRAEDKLRILTR